MYGTEIVAGVIMVVNGNDTTAKKIVSGTMIMMANCREMVTALAMEPISWAQL